MRARSLLRQVARRAGTARDYRASRSGRADVAVFHEFHAPPYGGGNQFLLALVGELERRALAVETNRVSGQTPACLYNSFNSTSRVWGGSCATTCGWSTASTARSASTAVSTTGPTGASQRSTNSPT